MAEDKKTLKEKIEDKYRNFELEVENDKLRKKVEKYEREIGRPKGENKAKVDGLSVAFCMGSVFLVMLTLRLCGVVGWLEIGLSTFAPIIIDKIINILTTLYVLFDYVILQIKQWFYNRKNPPIEF